MTEIALEQGNLPNSGKPHLFDNENNHSKT